MVWEYEDMYLIHEINKNKIAYLNNFYLSSLFYVKYYFCSQVSSSSSVILACHRTKACLIVELFLTPSYPDLSHSFWVATCCFCHSSVISSSGSWWLSGLPDGAMSWKRYVRIPLLQDGISQSSLRSLKLLTCPEDHLLTQTRNELSKDTENELPFKCLLCHNGLWLTTYPSSNPSGAIQWRKKKFYVVLVLILKFWL